MIDQSIIKCCAIAFFVFLWTHFAITRDAIFFYNFFSPCICVLFCSLLLPVKYREIDFRVNIIGALFTFNDVIDTLFFDPEKFQVNEYVIALITVIFVIRGRRKDKKPGSWYNFFGKELEQVPKGNGDYRPDSNSDVVG